MRIRKRKGYLGYTYIIMASKSDGRKNLPRRMSEAISFWDGIMAQKYPHFVTAVVTVLKAWRSSRAAGKTTEDRRGVKVRETNEELKLLIECNMKLCGLIVCVCVFVTVCVCVCRFGSAHVPTFASKKPKHHRGRHILRSALLTISVICWPSILLLLRQTTTTTTISQCYNHCHHCHH